MHARNQLSRREGVSRAVSRQNARLGRSAGREGVGGGGPQKIWESRSQEMGYHAFLEINSACL